VKREAFKERSMNNYIATFYSHFGALSLCKELQQREGAANTAELIPVPRELSTSCGVCVSFQGDDWVCAKDVAIDLEGIYRVAGGRYEELFTA